MRFDTTACRHYGDMDYSRRWDLLVEEFREQALLAEAIGMTTFWQSEHHFGGGIDGWNNGPPNPVLICMDLVGRTKTLRVGTGGVALPDWNPIRLAEDLAVLDIASGGRLDVGLMRGASRRTNIQFFQQKHDAAATQRAFNEVLDILINAWKDGPFKHKGEFYEFPVPGWVETHEVLNKDPRYYAPDGTYIALAVHPKPVQKPHPPLIVLGDSIATHEFAATYNLPIMSYAPSMSALDQTWTTYRQTYAKTHGAEAPGRNLSVTKATYVAPTMEQAIADAKPGLNALFNRSALSMAGRKKYLRPGEEPTAQDMQEDWFDFLHRHDIILVGTPDYVSERLEVLRDRFGCQHYSLFSNIPGLTQRQCLDHLALFGHKVMPRFQN
ncbi:LLM class flavin-dependent oxidoreductase [Pseudorhodoplanes sp.]|uniref:LLM class flavin-dependent oxidoreductase n=1 Tax=Pseudorhodoplanes sp. TaxID=1934341 RepID=UPI003D15056F